MRDPNRIPEIILALMELWIKYPDQRLGQLMDNVTSTSGREMYYIEDDETLAQIKAWIADAPA